MAQARGRKPARGKSAARKGAKRSAGSGGSPLWPWFAALAVVAGGIAAYDHLPVAQRFVAGLTDHKRFEAAAKPEGDAAKLAPSAGVAAYLRPVPRPQTPPDQSQTAAIIPPAPIGRPVMEAMARPPLPPAAPLPASIGPSGLPPSQIQATPAVLSGGYEGKFFLCGSAKQDDCVVSADRFILHGEKIRLVGIEVPDIKKPHCEAERIKASDAELRVRAFLDSGPFELQTWQGNDAQIDGHKLRAVTRNGRSLADILVNEGLAKRPGASKGWCG